MTDSGDCPQRTRGGKGRGQRVLAPEGPAEWRVPSSGAVGEMSLDVVSTRCPDMIQDDPGADLFRLAMFFVNFRHTTTGSGFRGGINSAMGASWLLAGDPPAGPRPRGERCLRRCNGHLQRSVRVSTMRQEAIPPEPGLKFFRRRGKGMLAAGPRRSTEGVQ